MSTDPYLSYLKPSKQTVALKRGKVATMELYKLHTLKSPVGCIILPVVVDVSILRGL